MFNFTPETTSDDIVAPIKAARKALADAALGDKQDATTLAKYVNEVATQEGRAHVRHNALTTLKNGGSATAVTLAVLRLALSIDDGWSGRTNDARRARHDGILDEIKEIVVWGDLDPVVARFRKEGE